MRKFKKKVVVAMSGGVDSSVAAVLLKGAGYDVIGVFMKLNNFSSEAEKRAKKVAKILKIPLLVLDLRKEFKKRIINYFLDGHKKGITPNPCVVCNKEIKFGFLLKKALGLRADFVATGHYARKQITNNKKQETIYKLLKGKDKEKDQSYFLWKLSQKQLKRILFPLGDCTRREVEKVAKKFKLPFTGVRKSQEICFIPTTINCFLKKYLKEKPGKIFDTQRKIIGEHEGLYFYTIGQRKGIKLPAGPFYVLAKDLKGNFLIITKEEKDLLKKELVVKNVNWISGKEPRLPLRLKAKIRYRLEAASAAIVRSSKSKIYSLKFDSSQRAITPGQSVVFYKGEETLGGGIIC